MTPLLNLRQSLGKIVAAVDVEDVLDEFSYGMYGHRRSRIFWPMPTPTGYKAAVRHFCRRLSIDPRHYEFSDPDFVPTKVSTPPLTKLRPMIG